MAPPKFPEDQRRALQFIALADDEGLVLARDVAVEVGWNPRTAGPRLSSLTKRGLLEEHTVRPATTRTERLKGYKLTPRGWEAIGRTAPAHQAPRPHVDATLDLALLDAASVGREIGKLVAIVLISRAGDATAALELLTAFQGIAPPQAPDELDAIPIAQQAIREAQAYLATR